MLQILKAASLLYRLKARFRRSMRKPPSSFYKALPYGARERLLKMLDTSSNAGLPVSEGPHCFPVSGMGCKTYACLASTVVSVATSSPGSSFTIFTVSTLTVITLRSKSRMYLGLPCSVAQSLGSLVMPLALSVLIW